MIVKLHKSHDKKVIVAVCDSDLIGKKFEENGVQLDCASGFYAGKEAGSDELIRLVRGAYIVNAVGKKSIRVLKAAGILSQTIKVQGIPHAQVLL
ncbi:MAG: DUF424 family protein [archaeon]